MFSRPLIRGKFVCSLIYGIILSMKIAIATTSELKIRALKDALDKLGVNAEIVQRKTDSGVSSQPFGFEEMTLGAKNRVAQCKKELNADLFLSVESGIAPIEGNFFDVACAYALSNDGKESISYSSGYFLPEWMVREVKEKNTELGHITQRLSGGGEKDPLRYLSGDSMRREELLSQAIALALVKLSKEEKYLKA
jgi:inosine/xanthosine triphosphatase